MLLDTLMVDLAKAVKSGDSFRAETLRYLIAAIKNFEIENYPPSSRHGGTTVGASPPSVGGEISDEDILSVIRKQIKTHKESIEMFKRGRRDDLVARESGQLAILESYLPRQLSEDEIAAEVKKIKTQLEQEGRDINFGMLMGEVMKVLRGRTEGGLVAQIVKEVLS